jgi:hypothetical protein
LKDIAVCPNPDDVTINQSFWNYYLELKNSFPNDDFEFDEEWNFEDQFRKGPRRSLLGVK